MLNKITVIFSVLRTYML